MSLVCVSIIDDSVPRVFASAEKSKSLGADIIEVRLDHLKEVISHEMLKELSKLSEKVGLPVILTLRPSWEGGRYNKDEEQRSVILKEGIELGFDYIDIELNTDESKRNSLIELAKKNQVITIVSYHDYERTPGHEEILTLIKRCADAGGDIAKVVVTNDKFVDALDVMKAARGALGQGLRFISLGMGRYGDITRFVAPIFGNEMVYSSLDTDNQAMEGQVDINTLKTKINFDELNPDTKVCGIIGNPLGHSLSPVMHNAAFKELGLNYVYLPFEIPEDQLEAMIEGMRTLGFRGLSVTHPYKSKVIRYLDKVHDLAREIEAVNTIVNDDGKLTGSNTDAYGALNALKSSGIGIGKENGKILIIGAGGAARAVAVPLAKVGSEIIIANRTYENGKRLTETLNRFSKASAIHLDEVNKVISDVNIVINCTPLGMKGYLTESPIPTGLLREDMTVFDMVYSPMRTPLLIAAERLHSKVIYGYEMFIDQGVKAFELWTGRTAPLELMRQVVLKNLEG